VLWKLVDVLAILAAVGMLLLLGPDVIGLKKWKKRFAGRVSEHVQDQSKASPSNEERGSAST
jgi:hypothetical protein